MPKRACRIIALLVLVTAACAPNLSTPRAAAPSPSQTPPGVQTDPAAEYCARHGGQLEWKQRAAGDIIGMCVFPDGSKCEQWAYALHACKPGKSLLTPVVAQGYSGVVRRQENTAAYAAPISRQRPRQQWTLTRR